MKRHSSAYFAFGVCLAGMHCLVTSLSLPPAVQWHHAAAQRVAAAFFLCNLVTDRVRDALFVTAACAAAQWAPSANEYMLRI